MTFCFFSIFDFVFFGTPFIKIGHPHDEMKDTGLIIFDNLAINQNSINFINQVLCRKLYYTPLYPTEAVIVHH